MKNLFVITAIIFISFPARAEISYESVARPPLDPIGNRTDCKTGPTICVEGAETRIISGLSMYKACWRYETKTTCNDNIKDMSSCDAAATSGTCSISKIECTNEVNSLKYGKTVKQCINYQATLSCSTGTSVTTMTPTELAAFNKENADRRLVCKPVQTCVGTDCYVTDQEKDKPDEDMPYVLALLEIGNQAGKYMDKDQIRLFNGVKSQCRSKRGFGALAACCKGGVPPKATDSSGKTIEPTNENAFKDSFSTVDAKYNDPNATANEEYKNAGANPYTYDSMYAPNEARYMLQGTESVAETSAGQEALSNGGGAKLTAMGYGYSPSGTATGDQQSYADYSEKPKKGTGND